MSEESTVQPTIPPRFVTLVRVYSKDDKKFTIELYSENAEQAYFKERTLDKLVENQENVDHTELIGTYRRVGLEIVGKEF